MSVGDKAAVAASRFFFSHRTPKKCTLRMPTQKIRIWKHVANAPNTKIKKIGQTGWGNVPRPDEFAALILTRCDNGYVQNQLLRQAQCEVNEKRAQPSVDSLRRVLQQCLAAHNPNEWCRRSPSNANRRSNIKWPKKSARWTRPALSQKNPFA